MYDILDMKRDSDKALAALKFRRIQLIESRMWEELQLFKATMSLWSILFVIGIPLITISFS